MKTLQKICTGYLLLDLFGTTIAAGLGIYALYVLTDGTIPSWQTAMLTRCIIFVPLFLFWGKVILIIQQDNREEMKTETGIAKFQHTTLVRVASQALVILFIAWQYPPTRNIFWLQLTMPILLTYAMVCTGFFIIAPLFYAIQSKTLTLKDVGTGLIGLIMYSIVFVPAAFLLIPFLEYNIQTRFTDHVTLIGVLSIITMFWYALQETWSLIGGVFQLQDESKTYQSARELNQNMINAWKQKKK